jgi:RNA polymerase sigma-70 factor (ECF subfamily)
MVRPDEAVEAELIRQDQRGNTDAFGQLVARHQQAVFRIAYRLTGDPQEAKDVAQEAFLTTLHG